MTNLKLKDIIDMPKGIWSWDTLKEMTLFTLQNMDRNELYRMKNFSKKSEHKLDEATKEWISPIKDWDIHIQQCYSSNYISGTDEAHFGASIDIYNECIIKCSFDFFYSNSYDSSEVLPKFKDLIYKLNSPFFPTPVSFAILHHLTRKRD